MKAYLNVIEHDTGDVRWLDFVGVEADVVADIFDTVGMGIDDIEPTLENLWLFIEADGTLQGNDDWTIQKIVVDGHQRYELLEGQV